MMMANAASFVTAFPPTRPKKGLQVGDKRIRPVRPRQALVAAATGRVRRRENVPGPAYVDSSCIDCDTCRWIAPETFSRVGSQSAVHAQPEAGTREVAVAAAAAAVACPTGSIRGVPVPRKSLFPMAMDDENRVYYLGYTNEASFAASSWLIITDDVAVMMDVPRYSSALAKSIDALLEALGCSKGLQYIVLSHQDDVAGNVEWANRYPEATRIIHADEARASAGTDKCERKLRWENGQREVLIDGIEIVSIPGHTSGHIALLDKAGKNLFTGDTLALSGLTGRLTGFPSYNSGGWQLQMETVERIAHEPFLNIYPGHGRIAKFGSDEERRVKILDAVQEWKADVPARVQ